MNQLILPNGLSNHNTTSNIIMPGQDVAIVIMGILNLFMFLGNIMSTMTILRNRILRKTVYYWFVVNLSIVDLLMALTVFPVYIIWEYYQQWPFSSAACNIVTTFDIILSDVSIYSKLLVAFDKFMLITRPFTYNGKITGKIAIVLIVSVWLLCTVFGIVSVYGNIALDTSEDFLETCVFVMDDVYTIVTFCIMFIIPFTFLTYTGIRLYCVARRHLKSIVKCHPSVSEPSTSTITVRNKRHTLPDFGNTTVMAGLQGKTIHTTPSLPDIFVWTSSTPQDKVLSIIKKKKRLTFCRPLGTVVIVILFFVVMCAPYWIVTIIDVGCSCVNPWVYEDIFAVVYNLNSLVNPYIYIVTDKKYRAAVKQLLHDIFKKCRLCRKNKNAIQQAPFCN